jgi:hypothetical protein
MSRNAREMNEPFTYQVSDLDQVVSNAGYAYCPTGDVEELALELEKMILRKQPVLKDKGLVIVICDAAGSPLHFRPLGTIH